ncbi:hypothetical protein M9Y10_022206 [Tritrichomonas musculus]|uniref:HNH nuclease domain-containing protein n=1 Tax=Tritrichomonas musculus TaxID=1915356 RepID=A0ABR2KTK1_9EUKA
MSQSVKQSINESVEFVPLLNFENDYEILNQYPFTIRKKSNHKIIGESLSNGYVNVNLNQKKYLKHRIIAIQFIPNPDPINNDIIDHINHDRTDNHLINLRWLSSSENNKNKSNFKGIQYEFIDDIPDDAIIIDYYETRTERKEFEENKYYYYHDESTNENKFYAKITDNLYKILHINTNKSGNEFVCLKDVNNIMVKIYINKFKHQHDLL